MKTVAIYARVSTRGQTVANQVRLLRQAAKRNGWRVVEIFKDEGISGARGREARPAYNALYKAIMRKDIDVVMAWSVDRLGRSLQDLVAFLNDLHSKGVDLYLHQQGIDTTTPGGKALFQMMGVFAEFERAIMQERIHAGLERARAQGKRLGRPPISPTVKRAIRKHRERGMSIKGIVLRSWGSVLGRFNGRLQTQRRQVHTDSRNLAISFPALLNWPEEGLAERGSRRQNTHRPPQSGPIRRVVGVGTFYIPTVSVSHSGP